MTQDRDAPEFAQIVYSQLPEIDLKEIDDARLELVGPRNVARIRQLEVDGELEKTEAAVFTGEVRKRDQQIVEDRMNRRRRFGVRRLLVHIICLQQPAQIGRHTTSAE